MSFVSGGCFLLQPSVMTLRDWNGFLVPDTCTCEVLELQRKNGHERDKEIVMDEGPHVYWIQGSSENWTSVTTVIHEYFPEFQGRMIAWRMVKSKYFPHAEKYAKYQDICKGLSDPKDKIEALIERQAIKRFGRFSDIINVIEFFTGRESGFVTGQVIYLGGAG